MNLQESIRRILREDKDYTKLLKSIIDSSDIFDYKHFCGYDLITPEERSDQYNFLNKNKIPYLIKVYFVGGPNSEVWPRTQAVRNKESDLMEELHEYITSLAPLNIEMMGSHVNSCDGYKKLMKRKYSTDDLQESIRRILREELNNYNIVYRGQPEDEYDISPRNSIWVTYDYDFANLYGRVKEYKLPKNLNILDTDYYVEWESLVDEFDEYGDNEEYKYEPTDEFILFLESKGYDGFINGDNILIFNKNKLFK